MRKRTLYTLALLYLWISTAIFLLTWIRWWIGIPCALAGTWMVLTAFRGVKGHMLRLDIKQEVLLVMVILLWVLLSGIGGFWHQTNDHPFRTQLFLNLSDYSWPVHNGQGEILCYFMGFWLVPAIVVKITHLYLAGYVFQVLWASVGIWLGMRLTFEYIGMARLRVIFVIIFFGGLEFLVYLLETYISPFGVTPRQRFDFLMFTSYPTDQIFFIFNQMFAGWIGTALILKKPVEGRSALVLACMALQAPFPCIPLFFLVLWQIGRQAAKTPSFTQGLAKVFSSWNIGALIVAFPVMYYLSLTGSGLTPPLGAHPIPRSWLWYAFATTLIATLGLWVPFLWKRLRHRSSFWILLTVPVAAYFVQIGTNPDLSSRVWIPLVYLLAFETGRLACHWKRLPAIRKSLMGLAFISGSWTALYTIHICSYHAFTRPYGQYRQETLSATVFSLNPDDTEAYRNHFTGKVPEGSWIIKPLDNEPAGM